MDGTHVSVRPPKHAIQAYRSRKATVSTNVLCGCNMDMQFIYVHAGWEGSANDSRVLEESIGDLSMDSHGHLLVLQLIPKAINF